MATTIFALRPWTSQIFYTLSFLALLRDSSYEPGFRDLALPLNSLMCSYERAGWLGSRDLGFSNRDLGKSAGKFFHMNTSARLTGWKRDEFFEWILHRLKLALSRPVARTFYWWVRFNKDTDQKRPEAQLPKGKIRLSVTALRIWIFLNFNFKLISVLAFFAKRILSLKFLTREIILSCFWEWQMSMSLFKKKKKRKKVVDPCIIRPCSSQCCRKKPEGLLSC